MLGVYLPVGDDTHHNNPMTPANAAPGASSFDPGLILLAFAPVFLLTIGA